MPTNCNSNKKLYSFTSIKIVKTHRAHIYIDLLHIGDCGDPEQNALAIIDSASNFIIIVPLIDTTSNNIIKALENNWFSIFNKPKYLTSDNGTQFTSNEFEDFLGENEILHILSSPYHPKSELAEIAVRYFKNSLRKLKVESPNTKGWVNFIPQIIAAHALTYNPSFKK